jgi:hypothetical protein
MVWGCEKRDDGKIYCKAISIKKLEMLLEGLDHPHDHSFKPSIAQELGVYEQPQKWREPECEC